MRVLISKDLRSSDDNVMAYRIEKNIRYFISIYIAFDLFNIQVYTFYTDLCAAVEAEVEFYSVLKSCFTLLDDWVITIYWS